MDELVRGVYARRDIADGYVFSSDTFDEDFYLAIPLHKGQLSCQDVINGEKLLKPLKADQQLTIDHIDGPYAENDVLRSRILTRGADIV